MKYSLCNKCKRPVGPLGCSECQRKKNREEIGALVCGLVRKMDVGRKL